MKIFFSEQDHSVNYVHDSGFEHRFVQRSDDYFIIYVSTFTGCNQFCKMCHLTATGQTSMVPASLGELTTQWRTTLNGVAHLPVTPSKVHLNFMARGEPLLNPSVQNNMYTIVKTFNDDVNRHFGFNPKDRQIKTIPILSTIFPAELAPPGTGHWQFKKSLDKMVRGIPVGEMPRVYYSLYSTNPSVRKKWLPKAMDVDMALNGMKHLKQLGMKNNKIHYAFIEGVNDSKKDIDSILDMLDNRDLLDLKWNIVRYNPYSEKYGKESPEHIIGARVQELTDVIGVQNVDVIPRVGTDVYASCGMFLDL